MSDKITPLPWITEQCGSPDCWCLTVSSEAGRGTDDMKHCVAQSGCLGIADAEFIVRACNAHDELLAACKGLLADIGRWKSAFSSGSDEFPGPPKSVVAAIAAIVKAEGQSQT